MGTLTAGPDVRRLEHRAAATLEVLCRRRGEVVSRQDLLEEVWRGRAVSANSVAIVIGDIRRALGDDARAPTLLKTVAKRGYLLAPPAPPPPDAGAPGRRVGPVPLVLAGALAIALVALAFALEPPGADVKPRLAVERVVNETGRADDAPLAAALDGLLVDRLARGGGVTVLRGSPVAGAGGPGLVLRSRLALWNGLPTLYMRMIDPATGGVVWAGMVVAPATRIAAETITRLGEVKPRVAAWRALQARTPTLDGSPRRSAAGVAPPHGRGP